MAENGNRLQIEIEANWIAEMLKKLGTAEHIEKRGTQKKEVRKISNAIKDRTCKSPMALAVFSLAIHDLSSKEGVILRRTTEKGGDARALVGMPSQNLLTELEGKIAYQIAQESAKEGHNFLNKIMAFTMENPSMLQPALDMLFKADLKSNMTMTEELFIVYCSKIGKNFEESNAFFVIFFLFCTGSNFSYRNQKEWLQRLLRACSEDKRTRDVLYEIFFLLKLKYQIIPVPSSQFSDQCRDVNNKNIDACLTEKERYPIIYWDIPDEYFPLIELYCHQRFEDESMAGEDIVNFYHKNEEEFLKTANELFEEIVNTPIKSALYSKEKDSFALSGGIFTNTAKMHRIAFATEGYVFPEVGLHFFCQRAHVQYDFYGSLEYVKREEGRFIRLNLPINVKGWFRNMLLCIIIDAYHSIVINEKIQASSIESPTEPGSKKGFIATKKHHKRPQIRRLPERCKFSHWEEDPTRKTACKESYGGKVPDGYTFVIQHDVRMPIPGQDLTSSESEKDLFTYTVEDLFRFIFN